MALNLSPRWKTPVSQTSEVLGPSYYFVERSIDERKNFAGFLSKTDRKSILSIPSWTEAIYNPKLPRKIIGGSSMLSRCKRDPFNLEKTGKLPGPSDYDPAKLLPSTEPKRRLRKLYVCKVPFYSEAKGPSVPTQIDENGYVLDEKGFLIKNPPDFHDRSMGPAYYKVNWKDDMYKEMYGGCRWSASKQPRKTLEIRNNFPGPATYDVQNKGKCVVNESEEDYREMARMFSFQPRTLDNILKKTINEDLPGPAEYNLQSYSKKSVNKYSAFGVSGNRFTKVVTDTPGPQEYTLPPTIQVHKVSRMPASFVYKTDRFKKIKRSKLKSWSPGPAEYNLPRAPFLSNRLTYKTVAFDCSAGRKSTEDDVKPGPSDYDTTNNFVSEDESLRQTSIFKSKMPRFEEFKISNCANAATYNVAKVFNQIQDPKSFAAIEIAFQTKSKPRQTFIAKEGPSPCDHSLHVSMPYKGFHLSHLPRFPEKDNGVPGPGTYTVPQTIDSSMYKSVTTFNLRMRENILGAKLRQAPDKTRDEWNRERTKRKKLKVFDRPLVQGMESWMDL